MRGIPIICCCLILAVCSTRQAFGWAEERTIGPYLIRSEFGLRDVQGLVDDLTDLQTDIERQLGLKCEPGEIQIHLFRNHSGYVNYLKNRIPDGIKRQALFVQGSDAGRVYAYRHGLNGIETDVRHETTHALLHTGLPFVPIWLDEGIAEYFEVSPGQRLKHNPHRSEIKRAIPFGWRPSIERLEAIADFTAMDGNDYRDAWGIVHYLLHGPPEAQKALGEYLKEIQSGNVPTALSRHLRKRIPNLEQSIVEHLKK